MKLRVKARYANQPLSVNFVAEQVVEVDEKLAAILLADSPDSFEVATDEPATPPQKMTKRAKAE